MFNYLKLVIGAMVLLNGDSFSEYRQLLIFGNEEHKLLVKRQLILLRDVQTEINERDIKIVVVNRQSELYNQYKVKSHEFTVILVGKDNCEKMRTHDLVIPIQLFGIIDAMPMRKQEMLKKKSD